MTVDAVNVRANLDAIRQRLAAAGGADVSVVAVTKGFGPETIHAAAAAGCEVIGESYAQELLAKFEAIEAHSSLDVHFIGQLQTNKVRQLAGRVNRYDSVDRGKLVREIARRDPGAAILVQVDTSELTGSGHRGKGGCPLTDLDELVEGARGAGLDVRGLMTVGPTVGGPDVARPGFEAVRSAVDRLGLTVCSMGMSADLDVAVACGSTEVRIGTALFGPRPVPTTHDQER